MLCTHSNLKTKSPSESGRHCNPDLRCYNSKNETWRARLDLAPTYLIERRTSHRRSLRLSPPRPCRSRWLPLVDVPVITGATPIWEHSFQNNFGKFALGCIVLGDVKRWQNSGKQATRTSNQNINEKRGAMRCTFENHIIGVRSALIQL